MKAAVSACQAALPHACKHESKQDHDTTSEAGKVGVGKAR